MRIFVWAGTDFAARVERVYPEAEYVAWDAPRDILIQRTCGCSPLERRVKEPTLLVRSECDVPLPKYRGILADDCSDDELRRAIEETIALL